MLCLTTARCGSRLLTKIGNGMSYGVQPVPSRKYRYLVNIRNVWRYYDTWSMSPDWDKEVTDVVWVKSPDMVASWWQMRDGKRIRRAEQQIVTDEELVMLLLKVQDV